MRIALNLASQPFIELRPLYARLRLWMIVLAVLAVPLGLLLRVEQRKAADSTARLQALQASIQRIQNQQADFQRLMREPANAAVLSESDFLNQLFARKAFSWTAVMMDLEDVLPAGVQVQNIDPIIKPNGPVTIRMRVAGPRERAVDLVRNLEHSRRFLQPRLASESAETTTGQNQGFNQGILQPVSASSPVDFDLLADYNPLPNSAMSAALSGTEPAPEPAPHAVAHRHRVGSKKSSLLPAGRKMPTPGGAR